VTALPPLGRAERELLLACGRTTLDGEHESRVRDLLGAGVEWEAVVAHARLHSVAPLLYHHLRGLGGLDGWAPEARSRLMALSHRAGYQNRHFAAENGALVEAFRSAGVAALVAKGLPICEELYGGLDRRPLIDLIFLVPAEATEAAREILVGRGYSPHPLRSREAIYRWSCPQVVFSRRAGILVEAILFADLVNWPRLHRLEPGDLLARARRIPVAGVETLVLSPVDLVLYLCLQADNHGHLNRVAVGDFDPIELLFAEWSNNRLVRFVDLNEAVRHHRGAIDWDVLVERARASGIEEPVRTSLSLSQSLLGEAAPPGVLEGLASGQRHRLRGLVYAGLVDGAPERRRAHPLARLAARGWSRVSASWQIQLGRLIGLAELAMPAPRLLRLVYERRSKRLLVPVAAAHFAGTLGRSSVSFARSMLANRLRGSVARSP
jgi:hypothetical protein